MAYIAEATLKLALNKLAGLHPFFGIVFPALKREGLPVGRAKPLILSRVVGNVLQAHFRVLGEYSGFYNPFFSSKPTDRWVSARYGSTTLQRISADTFSDVFVHEKNTSEWGWHPEYVKRLKDHLKGKRIPLVDLASWYYREDALQPDDAVPELMKRFTSDFRFSKNETDELFEVGQDCITLSEVPVSPDALTAIIGGPPADMAPAQGAILSELDISGVGPAETMHYRPGERLNVITGDNSLGKSFLLDTAWWSLTGSWPSYDAIPRDSTPDEAIEIAWTLKKGDAQSKRHAKLDRKKFKWDRKGKETMTPGLVLYARHDGSFCIWDVLRKDVGSPAQALIVLQKDEVWNGKFGLPLGNAAWACSGMIQDWVLWQLAGSRYGERLQTFKKCLAALSPSEDEKLRPGEPTKIAAFDTRLMPTLQFPYATVPVVLTSAGIQRILALAYVLTWSWHEHAALADEMHRDPQRGVIVIIDEAEAHLHPKWQRLYIPALLEVLGGLSSEIQPQLHIATHSPMILLGCESRFDRAKDMLHTLEIAGDGVQLSTEEFHKLGRADRWLTSPLFGLKEARSKEAEVVILRALALLDKEHPGAVEVAAVDAELRKQLAEDDSFWPRWRYFGRTLEKDS